MEVLSDGEGKYSQRKYSYQQLALVSRQTKCILINVSSLKQIGSRIGGDVKPTPRSMRVSRTLV